MPGDLVGGDPRLAVLLNCFSRQVSSRAQKNGRGHQFAPFLVRDAEDCGLVYFGDLINGGLDFTGIDILPTADDHLFGAINDVEEAILVLSPDVSGMKEPTTQCFCGFVHRGLVSRQFFLDVVPVTEHDAGPTRYEISEFAGSYRLAGCIDDSQIDTGAWTAARLKSVVGVLSVCQTSQETGFAQTVNLQQLHFRHESASISYNRGSDGRTSIRQHLQRVEIEHSKVLKLTQSVDHRRYEDRVCHSVCLNGGTKRQRVKALQRHLRRAEDRGCEHRGKVGDMEHRRRMEKNGLFTICQPVIQVMNVGEDVRVCKRSPFGGTSSSARVQKHKNRFWVVELSGVWLFFDPMKRIQVDYVLPLQPYSRYGKLRMPDQSTRASILDEPVNLGACVTCVDGNSDDAKQAAGID